MKIDRRITNGLAWAGVFVVVGIPAADILSAQFLGDPAVNTAQVASIPATAAVRREAPTPAPASQRPAAPTPAVATSTPKPVQPAVKPQAEVDVEVAAVEPAPAAKPATPAKTGDAVEDFLQSGRKLPSYISSGTTVAATPTRPAVAPAATPPATSAPVQTAAVQTSAVTTPAAAAPSAPMVTAAVPAKVAPVPMPLSMRPRAVVTASTNSQAPLIIPTQPMPPAAIDNGEVTAADLDNWETGPLSEFLAQRQRRSGNVDAYAADEPAVYYENEQRDRVVGPAGNDFFYDFGGY